MELIRSFSAKGALELSEMECEKIVRKATKEENVKVVKAKISHFGSYLGFLGEYFRLEIDAQVNGGVFQKLKFFMKSLPISDMKQRKMLVETGIFKKETILYESLIPDLSKLSKDEKLSWCPTPYLTRDDLLVLEDLSLVGYKILPTRFKFKQAHAEEMLRTLARFHCSSIVYNQIHRDDGKSIEEKFGETLFETSVCDITWFHAGLKAIYDIALKETKYGKSHRNVIEASFYNKIFGMIANNDSSPFDVPRVFAHRDIWKNNLLFKFDESFGIEKPLHCVLIDYQTARYHAITVDLMMAIVCTTRRANQEELCDYYTNFYYDKLEEELEKFEIPLESIMSRENFDKSCDFHKYFALSYNAIVLMITTIPREYFVDFSEDQYREFAEGDRSKFVLDYMSKDADYRECLVEAVEAVLEYFYKL